jgi:hypothetical protein
MASRYSSYPPRCRPPRSPRVRSDTWRRSPVAAKASTISSAASPGSESNRNRVPGRGGVDQQGDGRLHLGAQRTVVVGQVGVAGEPGLAFNVRHDEAAASSPTVETGDSPVSSVTAARKDGGRTARWPGPAARGGRCRWDSWCGRFMCTRVEDGTGRYPRPSRHPEPAARATPLSGDRSSIHPSWSRALRAATATARSDRPNIGRPGIRDRRRRRRAIPPLPVWRPHRVQPRSRRRHSRT